CVAAAFAQLLRLYSWPSKGNGAHTYTVYFGAGEGNYSYDFSQVVPWDALKDTYGVFCSEDAICAAAIGQFVFSLCVAGETDFDTSASGGSPDTAAYNLGRYYHYLSGTTLPSNDSRFAQTIESQLALNQALLVLLNTSSYHLALVDGLATDSGIRYVHL